MFRGSQNKMATTPNATPTESSSSTEQLGGAAPTPGAADAETPGAACAEASPAKKPKLANAADAETPGAADAKTPTAATAGCAKPHPTGESLGYQGKNKHEDGITVLVQDFSELNECPLHVVVYMDKKGRLYSMQGKSLNFTCAAALHKFLLKSMKKRNTVIRFRREDNGMQNGVHEDVLGAMVERAQEKDEELDEDSFAQEMHDLVDALADKFQWVDNCAKTCCQPVDLHLLVHRCD